MLEFETKLEDYYKKVTEYVLEEKSGDAVVNIRHIIENIIGYYTEKHAPEWIYAKQVEKIEQLHNIGFLDDFLTDTLHQLRKLANKGAHGEDVSTEEINKAIYPLRKIMDNFYSYLQKEGNGSINSVESKNVVGNW